MVAVTSGIDDTFLPFKNVGRFLRLKIFGEGVKIMTIILKGNNGEKIAGDAIVTATYCTNPSIVMESNATETITLNCDNGVALGANEAESTDFWFVVPPTKFEKGFTITIVDIEGNVTEKSTEWSYEVERNKIMSMAPFECPKSDANQQPANQIWYISSDESVVEPYAKDVFGAKILSNTYENGKGVITFDGDVTAIGDYAFVSRSEIISISIPESVTSIGFSAFGGCNMTKFIIPKGVKETGSYAFSDCKNLNSILIPDGITFIGLCF